MLNFNKNYNSTELKKYLMIDESNNIYIGKILSTDGNKIHIVYFYIFNKSTLKLTKKTNSITIKINSKKIIKQSDNILDCLNELPKLFDDKLRYKTYKKYIIAPYDKYNDPRTGIFEIIPDKFSFEKYYKKSQKIELKCAYYYKYNKIILHKCLNKTNFGYLYINTNNIEEFDNFDDAYSSLEIKMESKNYNL